MSNFTSSKTSNTTSPIFGNVPQTDDPVLRSMYQVPMSTFLSPHIVLGIRTINDTANRVTKWKKYDTFLLFLQQIKYWNVNLIEKETKRIRTTEPKVEQLYYDFLNNLLRKITGNFQVSYKDLKGSYYMKLKDYIHHVYIDVADKILQVDGELVHLNEYVRQSVEAQLMRVLSISKIDKIIHKFAPKIENENSDNNNNKNDNDNDTIRITTNIDPVLDVTESDPTTKKSEPIYDVDLEKTSKTEKTERSSKPEKTERTERSERTDRSERTSKPERTERTDRSERTSKPEKTERSERTDRSEKSHRHDERTDRSERSHRHDERSDRSEKSHRHDERSERSERSHRHDDRSDRSERSTRKDSRDDERSHRHDERTERSTRKDSRDNTDRSEKSTRKDSRDNTDRSERSERSEYRFQRPTTARSSSVSTFLMSRPPVQQNQPRSNNMDRMSLEDLSEMVLNDFSHSRYKPKKKDSESSKSDDSSDDSSDETSDDSSSDDDDDDDFSFEEISKSSMKHFDERSLSNGKIKTRR